MGNFLRGLFGSKKSISKIKPRMQSRRLELIGLEERVTPATISVVNNQVVIQLVDHEDISDLSTSVNGSQITINTLNSQANTGGGTGLTVNANNIVVNTGTGGLTGFAGISVLGFDDSGTDYNEVTIGAAGINLSSAPGGSNQSISINLSQGRGDYDALNVNGPIKSKGEGDVDLEASFGNSSLVIGEAGDITTTAGSVTLFSVDLRSAGDVTTDSGNVNFLNILTLSGNININSISGNLYMNNIYGPEENLTINQGSGMVAINNSSYLDIYNLSITTTNTTTSAISILGSPQSINSQGNIDLKAGGNIFILDDVIAASVNAKSTAGDVIFGQQVKTSQVGGFTSETSDATKATKISDTIDVGAGANALIKGNLITTSQNTLIKTTGAGNITITGNVDASATGNDLTLEAGSGVITISGNVGSGSIGFGDLIASGTGTFLASGTVKANKVDLNQTDNFSTSITFAKAVTTTGSTIVDGVYVGTLGTAPITFLDTITTLGDPATSFAQIRLFSEGGAINVAGAITGLDFVEVTSDTGDITLSGSVTTSGTNGSTSGYVGGDISIVSSTSGNILLSGNISAMGTGQITINNRGNVSLTINGNVSTVGGGEILLGADTNQGYSATGTGNLTINGTVSTTFGDIVIGSGGTGTVSVNKALTTTAAGGDVVIIATGAQTNSINFSKDATITSAAMVIFQIDNPTNTISFGSGANINAVDGITDGGAGGGNLNLANNLTTTNGDINIPFNFINLTGSVSMKAAGSGKDIFIGNINGAQNLTLEATDQINFTTGVGQNTPLNTITIANSAGMLVSSKFSAANVVLSDTTGIITFNGPTSITNSLTTAAKAYSVSFAGTTVLSGAPVFLNTGNVSFSGITSLPSGATITGGPATVVDLSGTIVSGGAFNIGADSLKTNIANFTTLNLTSTTNESTIANRVVLAGGDTFYLNGVGTLTLSGDSSDPMHMNNGFVGIADVTNGTINITGKLCLPSSGISLTNATMTGNGEVGGVYSLAASTMAPSGILTMGTFFQDATSAYKVSVFNPSSASQILLPNLNSVSINNSTLSLSPVASGLAAGNQFTIIDAGGSSPINGTFLGLPEGATFSTKDTLGNTVTFAISYVGGTGNDVTLRVTNVSIANPSAIPQPMVAGQPVFNFFTAVGADAGGGPMVTVTIDILPGLTTVPTYFSFFAYDAGFTGGVRVAINELDGDNTTTEIITGAGPGGGPNVKVFQFNFATLTFNPNPIASFFAFNDPNFQGGVYVAGGDVTGDGIGDLLVGAGAGGGPRVQVYAGSLNGVVTSSPISDFFAYSTAFTGGVVVAAGDRTGDNTFEVITGPASNGGYNIKSFNVAGAGNNPTLVENFFAFNDFTSIGGLSIATTVFDVNPIDDLVIGTTNTQFGVILNQNYAGIKANPFPGFTGAIRAGFADNLQTGYQALAAAGPGGGPVVTTFSVGATSLTQTDSLFVLDPAFTGGLFAAN